MTDFYFQIKGKIEECSMSNWAFPPLFSGKVAADNRKDAKALVESEFNRKFPTRVLKKDLAENSFLLGIKEIQDDDERTKSLFDLVNCEKCGKSYRVIDLYNDHNQMTKGQGFCSDKCKKESYYENRPDRNTLSNGGSKPVIYSIYNTKTGMTYVGKTTQIFTLRWYQHFFQGGSTKFHNAIKESNVEDWQFSVIESIQVPTGIDIDSYISDRESFWINRFDSIKTGYNTASVKSSEESS